MFSCIYPGTEAVPRVGMLGVSGQSWFQPVTDPVLPGDFAGRSTMQVCARASAGAGEELQGREGDASPLQPALSRSV